MRLYNAEGHTDKLLPNLVKSARLILSIYAGYIILGTLLYVIFGMSVFDALNHSISALSTGGFSTKAENIGFYDSVPIELVSILLMLLGNTNFFIHLLLLKGKLKKVFSHCETKLVIGLILLFLPLMVSVLIYSKSYDFWTALRISAFQFTTALTTTGFQSIKDFNYMPALFNGYLIILMLIGGATGLTAGGIKQYRISVMIKDMYWNIRDHLSNKKVVRTNYINKAGEEVALTEDDVKDNYRFIFLYLFIFIIGTSIFASFGFSLEQSMFEFASALGTVGISMGVTGYNAHPVILWTATIGMFLGRLEIYIVFLTLIRAINKATKTEVI
jgi:trk system potassium uptake protein TrkH